MMYHPSLGREIFCLPDYSNYIVTIVVEKLLNAFAISSLSLTNLLSILNSCWDH